MSRLRVLVCDDDKSVRSVVAGVADACGYEVVGQAGLALEALVMGDFVLPDVIVLDLALPGMSGIEVIPALRAAFPDVVVIAFTAHDSMRDEALAAGAFTVIDKVREGMCPLEEALRVVADSLQPSPA
jgi:CheY-like chemotaxis protein